MVRLGGHKRRWLDVVIPVEVAKQNEDGSLVVDESGDPVMATEERRYKVPLRGSLKNGEMLLFRAPDGAEVSNLDAVSVFCELLSRYIPREVVMDLDSEDMEAFYEAWDEASREDGLTQGE